jgi:hypothetical protein
MQEMLVQMVILLSALELMPKVLRDLKLLFQDQRLILMLELT